MLDRIKDVDGAISRLVNHLDAHQEPLTRDEQAAVKSFSEDLNILQAYLEMLLETEEQPTRHLRLVHSS